MLLESMALGSSMAKSTNSPGMILPLICGGTGGIDTSERVLDCRTWPTLILVTALGSVVVNNVGSKTLDGVSVCCCYINASDKASVVPSVSSVELSELAVESTLCGRGALACIVVVNCSSTFDN